MSIKAHDRFLPEWFTRIRTRQTVLPRFQRFEAWGNANITQLFNTILRDLPVGAVLVLEVGNEEPFISRPIEGAPATGERVAEHLLDGQQRLTALWRGLHNNYPERTYFLYLQPDEETGAPYFVDSVGRWQRPNDKERRPFWVNSPREQWKKRMVPLDLLGPGEETQQHLEAWAAEAIEDIAERYALLMQLTTVRVKFATFNLPFLSLPISTDKETALDVFIKMNTSAAPLTTFDIVVAQLEASMGKSLHDLVAEIRERSPDIAAYYAPEDLVIYASALLQGRAPTNATYMAKDFGEQLLANWEKFLLGVTQTVTFLEQERIFDAARLPTDVVVPVLVALWGLGPEKLDGAGRARNILRKYLWRASFSGRYERSTGSRSLVDFNELKALILNAGAEQPTIFDDAEYPLPQPEELVSAGWPVRKDRLARAILALDLKAGGLDLADGSAVTRANLAKREYHHLFPVAHLAKQEVDNKRIYLSLNCALVTWHTNRNISDKEPERYLAERREGTDLGEDEIRARLASHLIPYDEMVAGDYDTFLANRAALVHAAMTKLCASGGS